MKEMKKRKMIAYITKYCLTIGIQIESGEISDSQPKLFIVRKQGELSQYFHKGEWFKTELEAKADMRERIDRKIKSLKKSIEKLEKLYV